MPSVCWNARSCARGGRGNDRDALVEIASDDDARRRSDGEVSAIAIESAIDFVCVCCCCRDRLGSIGSDDDGRKRIRASANEHDLYARCGGANPKESGGHGESGDQKAEIGIEILSGEREEKKNQCQRQEEVQQGQKQR